MKPNYFNSDQGLDAFEAEINEFMKAQTSNEIMAEFFTGSIGSAIKSKGKTIITYSIPGTPRENITLRLNDQNDLLILKVKESPSNKAISDSIWCGDVSDKTEIKAKYLDGILTITLPTKEVEKSIGFIEIE